jgi:Spy/CpxP family protein refolding chaperone
LTQLKTAVDSNDSAKAEELLQKLREGFRQLSEGREKALDEFDKILKPEQRARIVVYAVQQAKESGRPVEHLIDNLFSESNENN